MQLRSDDELVNRWMRAGDPLGFERDTLAQFIRYELVEHMVGDSEDQWNDAQTPYTIENVTAKATAYLEYAWLVALNHRNLESQRSVIKMFAYRWLLGGPWTDHFAGTHGLYGVEALAEVSIFLGAPAPPIVCRSHYDAVPYQLDAESVNRVTRMLNGQPCRILCKGCMWKPETADE